MQALSELGYEVDLLCLPFGHPKDFPGVRVLRVGRVPGLSDMPIGPSIWKIPFAFKLWYRARQLIKAQRYDVVHAVEDAGIISISLARLSRAKLIFEKHSDAGSYRKGWLRNLILAAYQRAEARAIRHADAVIGTGPGLVAQAKAISPNGKCFHIFDIPSSLTDPDPERVRALRSELKRMADDVLITYVGSFAVYQGIDLLFGAIRKVAAVKPEARFVIIGGNDREIEERRSSLGEAADKVVFLGKIPPDQLPDYLAASDMLLSSRIAGTNTPLKLLDYLKVGRCILATDNQANRLILNEKTAFFVQPNIESFVGGIIHLIDNPDLREQLARTGSQLVLDKYNYHEFKRLLSEVYAAVLPANDLLTRR
jgi:glycosyltransferase involved in cell wall biosynthesis